MQAQRDFPLYEEHISCITDCQKHKKCCLQSSYVEKAHNTHISDTFQKMIQEACHDYHLNTVRNTLTREPESKLAVQRWHLKIISTEIKESIKHDQFDITLDMLTAMRLEKDKKN